MPAIATRRRTMRADGLLTQDGAIDRRAVAIDAHRQWRVMSRHGWSWQDCLAYSWRRARAAQQQDKMQAIERMIRGYDAAQVRGEVAKRGQRTDLLPDEKRVPTPDDLSAKWR